MDLAGWEDRDSGEMALAYDATNDRMTGSFGSQVFPSPQTDAFHIDSGTNYIGNYNDLGITQLSFDLYAEHVLPSDLMIRLVSGTDTFTYQFVLNALAVDSWNTYSGDMVWSYGWDGTSESSFNTALTDIDAVEIQITRLGTGAQAYYVDNITTYDTELDPDPGGGGGDSVVPEPQTMSLLVMASLFLLHFLPHKKTRPAPLPRATRPVATLLTALLFAHAAHAASPSLETFTTAPAGWEGTAALGMAGWDTGTGDARLTFYSTEGDDYSLPLPETGILRLVPSSAPAFTGDYEAAAITAIGFCFMAPTQTPSRQLVVLEWGNTNAVFLRTFTIATTGVWHACVASLENPSAWTPVLGSLADFATTRRDVTHIAIRCTRTGITARDYLIDDLFVAGRPTGAFVIAEANRFRIGVEHLLPGQSYLLETADTLAGPWLPAQTITATNTLDLLSVTNDAPALFLRLRFP